MSKFKTAWFHTGWGKLEETYQTGLFKKETHVTQKPNARVADYQQFADSIEKIYNDFDVDGFDVVNIIPLNIGSNEPVHATVSGRNNYVGEVGFSVTRGAVVVGKRRS